MEKPVYEETFTKEIYKDYLPTFMGDMYDLYRSNDGWTIGKPIIKEVDKDRIKVSVDLKKYDLNYILPYKELFIKTIKKSDIKNFITSMHETYTKEYGWIVDEPMVLYEENDEVTLGFPLTKEDTQSIKR